MKNKIIYKEEKPKKIVVAMSGGVDSSTVAAMLVAEGHEVIGITLQLYDYSSTTVRKGACCAGQDIYDAKLVAEKLGIPHYILDFESKFKQSVIDDFVESYVRGETPLPCVRCNQEIKFHDLLQIAKELGADRLATGHYVRKIKADHGYELHQGIETKKDQSYFLFTITNEQLEFLLFPLGNLTKEQTRKLALEYDLPIADKPDSQDICFVPNGNYSQVIGQYYKDACMPGKIIHVDGVLLGEHKGIINYTIGQRRGIGVASAKPLYVVKIDPIENIIYVGEEHHLNANKFLIKEVNWLGRNLDSEKENVVQIKIRSTKHSVLAKIKFLDNNLAEITLFEADKAITPGQACVIYDGSRMLGGGWITREIF